MTTQPAAALDTVAVKTKRKRPSRGMRKHIRRTKQEAGRTSIPGSELKKRKRVAATPKQ